jgi:hypothetical protein
MVPMESAASPADASAQSKPVYTDAGVPPAGVASELSDALASARATVSNFLDLAMLEARRAGLALVWMVTLAFVASICIVAAWVGVMAALALWAISVGIPPIAAMVEVAAINLLVGAILINGCIGTSRNLLFSATRRQVKGHSTGKLPAP